MSSSTATATKKPAPRLNGTKPNRLYWAALTEGRIECGQHSGMSTHQQVSAADLRELADLGLDHCEDCGKKDERVAR